MTSEEVDDLLFDSLAAIEAGLLALDAIARGEAANLPVLDALAEVLDDPRLTMTTTARAAAHPLRQLRALAPADGVPSPEARVLAESCQALIKTPPPPVERAV